MCRDALVRLVGGVVDAWRAVVFPDEGNDERAAAGTLTWGVPRHRQEEDAVADVTLHDDEQVTVTVTWNDERGRATAPPAGAHGSSSDPAVEVRDTGDGVRFVVVATGRATENDIEISFGGEGVSTSPSATVRVIRWSAVGGTVSWGEPEPAAGLEES